MNNNDEPGLVKVSAIQTRVKRKNKDYNIKRNLELVEEEAGTEKPHIICIPNYFFQMGLEPLPGPATEGLMEVASRHEVYIIGGMAEKIVGKKGFNTGFIIFPDGSVLVMQHKIHMIPMELFKLQGGRAIDIIELPFAKLGCVLCNDIFFPEVARCLAVQGAEILFAPSALGGVTIKGLEVAARARAIENQVYVVNANIIPYEVAIENPDLEMGRSGIYSPFPEKIDLVRAGKGDEVIRTILDLDELRELKQTAQLTVGNLSEVARTSKYNMLTSRRPSVYSILTEPEGNKQ